MKKLLSAVAVLAVLLCVIFPPAAHADGNLDEIENYQITVDMADDGTMNIRYHIDWKVLDDTSEGPLTWVKIGIPNRYVDNIKALSDTIQKIRYSDDGGDYVCIDLDRTYYANETVALDFSIHQSHMYTLDQKNGVCSYRFTPGWFDNCDVKSMKIRWNAVNVMTSDSTGTDDGYLVWRATPDAGQVLRASVSYRMEVFTTSDDGQSQGNAGDSDFSVGAAVVIVAFIAFFVIIIRRAAGGGYRGGFGTRGYVGGGHCACASSCACACACACAGGGRAGCSAKNFYGSAVRMEAVMHRLAPSSREEPEKPTSST